MASRGSKLGGFFANSVALARQVSLAEHRANPFVNILNVTSKTTRLYPDLLGERTIVW